MDKLANVGIFCFYIFAGRSGGVEDPNREIGGVVGTFEAEMCREMFGDQVRGVGIEVAAMSIREWLRIDQHEKCYRLEMERVWIL